MTNRLPIVGVVGSAKDSKVPLFEERAIQLGEWLASLDVHLVTGAGPGAMKAVCKAFNSKPHKGCILGIVPDKKKDGYPNDWVEIPIRTHLPGGGDWDSPNSRNHIVVLTSSVIIALPGDSGTASEVQLALKYQKPLVAFLKDKAEIVGLPEGTAIVPDLSGIKEFVLKALQQLN